MLFGWDLENGRNGVMVVLQNMSNIIRNVLVDQDDANVIPRRKVLECFFDLLELGVLFDNQEVGSLGCPVADSGEQEAGDGIL